VVLAVEGDERAYAFRVRIGDRWTPLGDVERALLSTERAGGFVGVHLGLYAQGRGDGRRALVRWFDYRPLQH
jgi:alpha-N-arabinofuranosidase